MRILIFEEKKFQNTFIKILTKDKINLCLFIYLIFCIQYCYC